MRKHRRGRRRRRIVPQSEVELNMAAMLDMAFQLLAFFILTFNPSDIESQISMLMPLDKPLLAGASSNSTEPIDQSELQSFGFPIEITCYATAEGGLRLIRVGDQEIPSGETSQMIQSMSEKLESILKLPGFETVQLNVETSLRYESLIRVLDACLSQRLSTGEPLVRISINQVQPK